MINPIEGEMDENTFYSREKLYKTLKGKPTTCHAAGYFSKWKIKWMKGRETTENSEYYTMVTILKSPAVFSFNIPSCSPFHFSPLSNRI